MALGQDEEAAYYCQLYLRLYLPGLYFDMFVLSISFFLTAMEFTMLPMFVQFFQIFIHYMYSKVSQDILNSGYVGLPITTNLTRLTTLLVYAIYFLIRVKVLDDNTFKQICKLLAKPFDKEIFRNMGQFV